MHDLRFLPIVGVLAFLPWAGCFDPDGVAVDTDTEGQASTGTSDTPTTLPGTTITDTAPPTSSTQGDDSSTSGMTDPSETASATGEQPECTEPNGSPGMNCDATHPYCLDAECVGCGNLNPGSCAALDAAAPVCGAAGECVECTADSASLCGGATPVCFDEQCAACTTGEQCESGTCLVDSGYCLATEVSLSGVVFAAEEAVATPVAGVDVFIENLDPSVSFLDTPMDGSYMLDAIPPGSLVEVEIDVTENWAGDAFPAFTTVRQVPIGLTTPQTQDLEAVRYEWLAETAIACGFYDFGAAPVAWDVLCTPGPDGIIAPGCTGAGDGISAFVLTRSSIVGTLFDTDGTTPFTDPLSRGSLSAVVSHNALEAANVEANPNDTDAFPFHVCWLNEQGGELVGSPSAQNTTGHFVLFRVRNAQGLGQGTVALEATGFDPATVRLPSSGGIGVTSLVRNNADIVRDFALDIYPMFQEWGCVNCHSAGGIGTVNGTRAGFEANWSGTPTQVYNNLVGPGTVCDTTLPLTDPSWGLVEAEGFSSGRLRVCVNAPEESLLIMRPTAGLPLFNEVHPIDIFPGPDHPQMEIVRDWVEEGANPPADQPVDFATEVYPIFTTRGCVACHTGCGGGSPGAGCVLDTATNTFFANWNAPVDQVYANLTGPGTNCADAVNNPLRVCVNAPESSLFVVRPLAGVPVNDPHPVDIFASVNDPDLATMIRWITQGALPNIP